MFASGAHVATPEVTLEAIQDVLGAPLKVRFEAGASAPTQTAEPTPVNEEESADELFGYANERIK